MTTTTTTTQFATELASVRSQILESQAKRGITLATTDKAGADHIETFRWNALTKANAAYDKAVNAGWTIREYTNDRGVDIRDR